MALLKKLIQKGSERDLNKKEGGSTRGGESSPISSSPVDSRSRPLHDAAADPKPPGSPGSTRGIKPSSSFRNHDSEKAEGVTNTAETERQLIEKALLDDGCLVYSGPKGEPKVRGGTIDALLKRLTATKHADASFTVDFLLTYRSFTTPRDLLTLLSARFFLDPPAGTANADEWKRNTLTPIRLKVAAVLKNWLTNHWHDFEADDSLTSATITFLDQLGREGMKTSADALRTVIDRKRQEKVEGGKEVRKQFSAPPPTPVITPALASCMSISGLISMTHSNSAPSLQPTDLDPLETARQMCLIDAELFAAVRPFELLKQAWTKPDAAARAPNILKAIERFNQVTAWVATEILLQVDASARLRTMAHFIDVCQHLSELNNLFGTMAVVAGFGQAPIFRLKEEPLLAKKHQQKFAQIRELLSREKNFANYRAHLHAVSPPLVPYLGAHLTDLVFVEDGNKDELDSTPHLINFDKRYMIAKIIRELQSFQNTPYCLEPVPFMADYLRNARHFDDNALHELSAKILPRTTSVRTAGRLELSGSSGNLLAPQSSRESKDGNSGSRIGGRGDSSAGVTSPVISPSTSPRSSNSGSPSLRTTSDALAPPQSQSQLPSMRAGVSPGVVGSSTLTRTSHGTSIGTTRAISPQRIETTTNTTISNSVSAPIPHFDSHTKPSSDSTKSAVRSALLQLLQNDPQSLIALYREDLRTELGRQSLSTSASVSEAVVAGESSSSRKLLAEMNTFQAEVDSQAAAVVAHVEDVIKLLQPPS